MDNTKSDEEQKNTILNKFSLLKKSFPEKNYPDNLQSLTLVQLNDLYLLYMEELRNKMNFDDLKLKFTTFVMSIERLYVNTLNIKSKTGLSLTEIKHNFTELSDINNRVLILFDKLKLDFIDNKNIFTIVNKDNKKTIDFYNSIISIDVNIDNIEKIFSIIIGNSLTDTCIIS